jgi:hypothetical protein
MPTREPYDPTYEQAVAPAGDQPRDHPINPFVIRSVSHDSVRWGRVPSHTGVSLARESDGWVLRFGVGPLGTPEWVSSPGRVIECREATTPQFWRAVASRLWSHCRLPYELLVRPDPAAIITWYEAASAELGAESAASSRAPRAPKYG